MAYIHGPSFKDLNLSHTNDLPALQDYIIGQVVEISQKDSFLSYELKQTHSPFLLPDIHPAIALIREMVHYGKHFLLYGDRDTDGVSSTSLLSVYIRNELRKTGGKLSVRTSTANDDYGLCLSVMQNIKSIKPDILITLDFGTSNYEEINELASMGIKVIVLDHHEIPKKIPNCLLINPKREDSLYPEKRICTSVLSMKLVQALLMAEMFESIQKNSDASLFPVFNPENYKKIDYIEYLDSFPTILEKSYDLLDLASIGTITDMMPLLGENRIIVKNGLNSLIKTANRYSKDRLGLFYLLKNLGINSEKIVSKDLGWSIGPVLNAAGRMGKTEIALQLLLTETDKEAEKYALEIININKERRERTKRNLFRVEKYFDRKKEREERKIIFCYEPDMEPGVSGIVATKLVDKYKKPTVFITPDHGKARGSVRSYGKENVINLLEMISDLLNHYGGHPEAGGFSISIEKIPQLEQRLIEVSEKWLSGIEQNIENEKSLLCLEPQELQEYLFRAISILEPFGQANPIPILSIRNAEIVGFKNMGDGSHARFSILKASPKIKGVIWNKAQEFFSLLSVKSAVDIWGSLEENYYNGTTTLQFVVTHFE